VIIRSYKDEERRKASKWIQGLKIIKLMFLFTTIVHTEVCDDAPDMERLLMEIVEHRFVAIC
jgi:hypothetical protein